MTQNDDTADGSRRKGRLRGLLKILLGVLIVSSVTVGVAVGAPTHGRLDGRVMQADNNTSINNSDYYQGTVDVANESWFAGVGDADLTSLGHLLTRATSYFVGTGDLDASGTGFQGILLTGLLMAAGMIGAVASVGVGTVGGSVIAVVIGFGMTELGLAPAWFRVLLLFGIGIIAYVALTNILEAR